MKKQWIGFFIIFMFSMLFFILPVCAAEKRVYYVRPQSDTASWMDKPQELVYTDLQKAMDEAALEGSAEVWVAVGEYKPHSAPNLTIVQGEEDHHFSLRNGVTVIGGFKGNEARNQPYYVQEKEAVKQTVLSGGGKLRHVFYHPDAARLDSSAILENVTISNGSAREIDGGGMYNYESSPMLIRCRFYQNKASKGAAMYNHFSSPILQYCTFEENAAEIDGGAVFNRNAAPQFLNCVFRNNSAKQNGGAMYNETAAPIMNDCDFLKNQTITGDGGALYNDLESAPEMMSIQFIENSAAHYGGAISNKNSRPVIANAAIMQNSSLYGGGVYNTGSHVIITNVTVSLNKANDGGGVYSEKSSQLILANGDFNKNVSYGNGGGISSYLSETMIANSRFTENTAVNGGGISNDGGYCSLLGSLFVGNYASASGGGVISRSSSHSDSRLEMMNVSLYGNMTDAALNGAGVFCSDYTTVISNTIVSGNTAAKQPSDFVIGQGANQPIFKNNMIGSEFHQNEREKKEVGFDPGVHVTADYMLTAGVNPAAKTGDAQIFADAFNQFVKELNTDKKLIIYDIYGGKRELNGFTKENAMDLGAVESNAASEAWKPPAPVITAVSNDQPYFSSDKTRSAVQITVSSGIKEMNNFPMIPKLGYLSIQLNYDSGAGAKIYRGSIYSAQSQEYLFWTSLNNTLHSRKISFATNISNQQPIVRKMTFDQSADPASVSIETKTVTVTFDHYIKTTAQSDVKLYAMQGSEQLQYDLTKDTTALGEHLKIDLSTVALDRGVAYQLHVGGYKDDYNNMMAEYIGRFATEPSTEDLETKVTGILADPTTLPSQGGFVNLTVTGGRLEFADGLSISNGMTSQSALLVENGASAKTQPWRLPENTGEEDKIYTFTVFLEGVNTGKEIQVIVEKPVGNGEKDIHLTEKSSEPFITGKRADKYGPYEMIVNGMPFTTEEMDTSQGVYVMNLNSVEGVASAILPNKMLKELREGDYQFALRLCAPWGIYQLPVSLPEMIPEFNELLKVNGLTADDISFKISIADVSRQNEKKQLIQKNLVDGDVIGVVTEFQLELLSKDGKIIGFAQDFTEPLVKMLPIERVLQDDAGVFKLEGEKLQFVPFQTAEFSGINYVSIPSYENGVYLIAENHVQFNDIQNHWAKKYIHRAAALGVVQGREEGIFEPDGIISRAEFCVLLSTTLGLPPVEQVPPYADVEPGVWYYEPIMRAKSAGLLNGLSSVNFSPGAPITREEMACMLSAALLYGNVTPSSEFQPLAVKYKDYLEINENYLLDVQQVIGKNIMSGTDDNVFGPKSYATRAEAAVAQVKLMDILKQTVGA